MRNLKNTTNKNLIASVIIAIFILLSGCKKTTLLSPSNANSNNQTVEKSQSTTGGYTLIFHKTVDLLLGEDMSKVGKVDVTDLNNGTVEVKYTVDAPWKIHSVRLYVGAQGNLPVSDGECITDLFPYKKLLSAGGSITSTSVLIAKSSIPTSGIVSAYAKIINTETLSVPTDVWASGTKVSETGISMYFNYALTYMSPPMQINPIKNF